MDKAKDFEKSWEEYKEKSKQEIKEMIGIIQNAVGVCAEPWAKLIAEELHKNRYRKIPENAVVLTREELDEVLDACKVVMIVHDDDGERYVSYDDYKEFTDRLGKIARQRKVRIEQLEKLLDDRCDSCIERGRKETAEKFAEKTNQAINAHRKKVGEDEYVVDARRLIFEVNEICKGIIGGQSMNGKYVECQNCKYQYDCERTYLGGCTDGKEWEEDEGEMLGESKND